MLRIYHSRRAGQRSWSRRTIPNKHGRRQDCGRWLQQNDVKMASLYRPACGHVCWGRSASQSTASNASAVSNGRKKSRREYLIVKSTAFTVGRCERGRGDCAALDQSVLVDAGHVADVVEQLGDAEVRPARRRIVHHVDVDADAVHVDDAEVEALLDGLRVDVPRRAGRQPVLRQLPLVLHAPLDCRRHHRHRRQK